jgi:Tfp pilus assembly protein PilX
MRRLRDDESGIVLVVAMLVIATTLALGLATFAFTQDQQRQSGNERVKESAFNLAESALNSAANYLGNSWPSSTSTYPSCTQAGGAGCPDTSTVSSGFTSTDYNSAPTWTTNVYDNGAPTTGFYKAGTTDSQPSYDANLDGAVWVRATATARGKTRTVVGLVKSEPISEIFPRNVITANNLFISVPQDFVIVDELGYAATPSSVALRCTQAGVPNLNSSACANWQPPIQIQPGAYTLGNTNNACPDATNRCALTDLEIGRLRQVAKQQNNYYAASTCPTTTQINQPGIVFAENCNLSITNAGDLHTKAAPGVLMNYQGTITLGGTAAATRFYGLIYGANRTNVGVGAVTVVGGAHVIGAVATDEAGRVQLGQQTSTSRNTRLVYDPNVFNLLSTIGTVTITPGTFREL